MGVMSLRLNKRMYCTFMDETGEPSHDMGGILDPASRPFQWICPPVSG